MVLQNVKKELIVLLVSLVLYLPLSYVINWAWAAFELNRRQYPVSIQASAYSFLNAIEYVPQTTADLCALADKPLFREYVPRYVQYYDPNAWREPGQIFFLYERGPFCWVTFGDGTQAVLTYLIKHSYLRKPGQPYPRTLDTGLQYFARYPRVVTFGIVAMLIYAVVAASFLKTKGVKANKAHSDRNKSMTDTCSGDG